MIQLQIETRFVERLCLAFLLYSILIFMPLGLDGQQLPGFKISGSFDEQQKVIENLPADTRILINAPLRGFDRDKQVLLILYALPNGNTIEQTFGKKLSQGDDWHFDIQHIGAQTRFLRKKLKNQIVVTAYLESKPKSWPMWVGNTPDSVNKIRKAVDDLRKMFEEWNPEVVFNSHSGGGRFIFSFIGASDEIPEYVGRIAFLDSSYGYDDNLYGSKITRWLKSDGNRYLCTLAYNDSVVVYNGKQLVSPTGGTWYRSKLMRNFLAQSFLFIRKERDTIIWHTALKKRVEIILKPNDENKIFHTSQVEFNGFIHSILSGTRYERKGYRYFGKRAYSEFVSDSVRLPIRQLNIPPRDPESEPGSLFMKRIGQLPLQEREEEIFKTIASGNVPGFLRNTVTLTGEFADSNGIKHKVSYEVMPDYLAVGSDTDFCRIPMNPHTAQRLASIFGASLITPKLSDHIFENAKIKLEPFNYIPVGNANELVMRFEDHNRQIEKQIRGAGGSAGDLVAGIKKDVVLTERLVRQPDKVAIYGWHKPDGKPIQPLYCGHVDWYVDYSHGIRFINNQVEVDGIKMLFTDILKDPVLYTIFSNESTCMEQVVYIKEKYIQIQ